MAGIGFTLRKLIEPGTYTAYVRAYTYAAVVGTGPWLCSILALAALGQLAAPADAFLIRQTFASTVVYVFAGTLILTGPIQMIVTRYLADLIYKGAQAEVGASFGPTTIMTAALLFVFGAPFFLSLEAGALYRLLSLALFVTIGCTWIVMVFLTTSGHYKTVVGAFALGTLVSVVLGTVGGRTAGLDGYLAGYLAGQFFIFMRLLVHVMERFGAAAGWDTAVLAHCKRYPSLLWIGLAWNLAIWIDKLIFWGSAEAGVVAGLLATTPDYDSSTFLALLTVLPALTHFFLIVEIELAEAVAAFYDAIFFKRPLTQIRRAREHLEKLVVRAFFDILRVQALVTGLCVYFAGALLPALGLPFRQLGMFRFACIGSVFLSFTLFAMVVLLYLDRRRDAVAVTTLFGVLNGALTAASLQFGFVYHGAGFAVAGMLALLLAVSLLLNRVRNLEYLTFAATPINGQMAPRPGLRVRPNRGFGLEHPL